MKKTIEQIVKRDDYCRLTKQLKERAEELAEIIFKKMDELDLRGNLIKATDTKNQTHYIKMERRCSNVGSYEFLAFVDKYDDRYSLFDINHSYHYGNDYCCWIEGADHAQALWFLNCAGNILEQLDVIEDDKAREIENALSNTENLISAE